MANRPSVSPADPVIIKGDDKEISDKLTGH